MLNTNITFKTLFLWFLFLNSIVGEISTEESISLSFSPTSTPSEPPTPASTEGNDSEPDKQDVSHIVVPLFLVAFILAIAYLNRRSIIDGLESRLQGPEPPKNVEDLIEHDFDVERTEENLRRPRPLAGTSEDRVERFLNKAMNSEAGLVQPGYVSNVDAYMTKSKDFRRRKIQQAREKLKKLSPPSFSGMKKRLRRKRKTKINEAGEMVNVDTIDEMLETSRLSSVVRMDNPLYEAQEPKAPEPQKFYESFMNDETDDARPDSAYLDRLEKGLKRPKASDAEIEVPDSDRGSIFRPSSLFIEKIKRSKSKQPPAKEKTEQLGF